MIITYDSHKQFLIKLLKGGVNFILIGGYAVNYYGYGRATGDMDVLLEPNNENRDRLIEVLNKENFDASDLTKLREVDFTKPFVFFIGEIPLRIDFLTKINLVTYEEADAQKKYFPLEDIQVPVISLDHLVLSKNPTGRENDKTDIEYLQRINIKKG